MEEGLIGRYASLLNCRSMGLPFTYLGIPIGANPSKVVLANPQAQNMSALGSLTVAFGAKIP